MTVGVLIIVALRVLTFVWPLATEVLAFLWWAGAQGPSTLPTLLIIAVYLALVFSPTRFLFSRLGVVAVMLLLAASLLLLGRYWSDPSGMPQMIWVHLGFAAAWLATLTIKTLARSRRA